MRLDLGFSPRTTKQLQRAQRILKGEKASTEPATTQEEVPAPKSPGAERMRGGQKEFYVRWAPPYDADADCTWEPMEHVEDTHAFGAWIEQEDSD